MNTTQRHATLSRWLLLVVAVAGSAGITCAQTADQSSPLVGLDQTVEYVLSCRKSNGAFGPKDQDYTDAAWNYPAVHTLRLLGEKIPAANAETVLKHGLGYPKGHAGYGHWLVYHQAMTRWLLTEPDDRSATASGNNGRTPRVRLKHQGFDVRYYGSAFGTGGDDFFNVDGASTAERFRTASELGFYNLSSLHYLISAILADERAIANSTPLVEFILKRQAANGGFVDLRTADAAPVDQETHISHTFHAVAALSLLNVEFPRRNRCVDFVRSCQVRSLNHTALNNERNSNEPLNHEAMDSPGQQIGVGGFRIHPDANRSGNYSDVYYTYCGLNVLDLLDAQPDDSTVCVDWLATLQNHDGGFGDRPGWRSRLYSTYYSVHSLEILARMRDQSNRRSADKANSLESLAGRPFSQNVRNTLKPSLIPAPIVETISDASLKVYQGLFKTPIVEPEDLAELQQRGFNLLAIKTDDFSKAAPLLEFIQQQRSPLMDVVLCPEAYPHRLKRAGSLELHHVGNFTLDPRWDESQRHVWLSADAAGRAGLSWNEYQRRVLTPLQKLGSLCYPEQDFELEVAYNAYDDGVYNCGGYDAVQVGFNWSPRDFVRVFPWRERYVDKLVPVADADAHGDLKKWSPQLDHTRHLYIAGGSTYADFLEAARLRRVVCAVYGVEGVPSGVSYYGPPAAVIYVKQRVDEWKWW
jgi:prenyltransferase beta subunit